MINTIFCILFLVFVAGIIGFYFGRTTMIPKIPNKWGTIESIQRVNEGRYRVKVKVFPVDELRIELDSIVVYIYTNNRDYKVGDIVCFE